MKCDKKTMLLYAVTDRAWVGRQSLYEQVECALKGGATCVQVREKKLGDEDFLEEAKQIAALCKRYGVPLFINDNVDVAIACGAEGVHVGQEDMAAAKVREKVGDKMMIGVSVHSVEEAKQAVRDGADCLGVGAMFSTSTKTDVDVLPKETRSRPSVTRSIFRSWPSAGSTRATSSSFRAQAWTVWRWSAPSSRRRTSKANAASCARCRKKW